MRTISTGELSNLKTYRNIALILSGSEKSDVVKFFDNKIQESPNGESEEVIADETQVMYLIMSMVCK
jgi:hypothetical protein